MIYLEGGRQYVVRESDVPQGYANVTEDVVVDLSGYTSPMQAYEVITVTLENRPNPRLNVVKRLVGSETPIGRTC